MTEDVHVTDLSAGYALGALSGEERELVDSHIAHCADCRADLLDMIGIAGTLPLACDDIAPPDQLKARLLAAASGDARASEALARRSADEGARGDFETVRGRSRRRPDRAPFVKPLHLWWLTGAATAAALLLAILLVDSTHQRVALQAQIDSMSRDIASLTTANAQLSARADQQHAVMSALANGTVWTIPPKRDAQGKMWSCSIAQPPERGRNGTLLANLPEPPSGKAYEVWVMRGKRLPHSAGMVMHGGMSELQMSMPVVKGDLVAFTLEPMPGSSAPTSPPVMELSI